MNATQKLFDRFERSEPSWLPIIMLSTFGIIATAICVQLIAKVSEKEFPKRMSGVYLAYREIGRNQTMLYQVDELKDESISSEERDYLNKWKQSWSQLTYLGLAGYTPAFPPENTLETGRAKQDGDPWPGVVAVWATKDSQSIVIGFLVHGDDQEIAFDKLMSISRNKSKLIATSAILNVSQPADPVYGDHETVIQSDPQDPLSLQSLRNAHQERQSNSNWDELGLENYVAAIQDYLNLNAFAFLTGDGMKSMREIGEFDSQDFRVSDDRIALMFATIDLGTRNGLSKQYDRYVVERMARDLSGRSEQSEPAQIVIHPLSCPIYVNSVLQGVPPDQTRSVEVFDEQWVVPHRDFPNDVFQQLETLATGPLDLKTIHTDLHQQLLKSPQYEPIFEMQEPFPATVYQRKPSND